MNKKDTFSDDVKSSIHTAQNGYSKGSLEPIHSYHHLLKNSVANRKRFPLFIQSPMNCVGLSFNEHSNKAHLYRIKPETAQVYEDYLHGLIIDIPF